MARPTSIQKGSSLPFTFDRGGESIEGWVCTIYVKSHPSDTAAITRAVTPGDGEWSDYLTATETDTLTEGTQYFIIGVLTKAGTDEEEKPPVKFYVSKGWV